MTNPNPWAQFTDLAEGQAAAWLSSPQSKLNELQKFSYVLPYMLPGSEPHQFLKSGDAVKSKITLKEAKVYSKFDAGELISFPQTNTAVTATSHWSMARAPLSWNDREILLQNSGFDAESRAQTYFDVYFEKWANFMRSTANAIDDEYFAVPTASMESVDGNTPRSLFMLINECNIRGGSNTWASAGSNAPVANGYWPGITTIAGIDPTLYPIPGGGTGSTYWGCTRKTYSQLHNASSEGFRVLGSGDLTYQMDAMLLDLNWAMVPKAEKYSAPNGKKLIITTRQGIQAIRQSLVSTSNDRWMGMDAAQMGNSINYGGHTVIRAEGMEKATVYPDYGTGNEADTILDESTRYTEGGFNSAGSFAAGCFVGPRLMFVDTSDIVSVFHRDRFFYTESPRKLFESRPDTWAMYLENWRLVHPKRLRSSGFLSPSGDITGVTYTS